MTGGLRYLGCLYSKDVIDGALRCPSICVDNWATLEPHSSHGTMMGLYMGILGSGKFPVSMPPEDMTKLGVYATVPGIRLRASVDLVLTTRFVGAQLRAVYLFAEAASPPLPPHIHRAINAGSAEAIISDTLWQAMAGWGPSPGCGQYPLETISIPPPVNCPDTYAGWTFTRIRASPGTPTGGALLFSDTADCVNMVMLIASRRKLCAVVRRAGIPRFVITAKKLGIKARVIDDKRMRPRPARHLRPGLTLITPDCIGHVRFECWDECALLTWDLDLALSVAQADVGARWLIGDVSTLQDCRNTFARLLHTVVLGRPSWPPEEVDKDIGRAIFVASSAGKRSCCPTRIPIEYLEAPAPTALEQAQTSRTFTRTPLFPGLSGRAREPGFVMGTVEDAKNFVGCAHDLSRAGGEEDSDDTCPICYNAQLGAVTKCGHWFCPGCIRTTLAYSRKCPYCNTPLMERDVLVCRATPSDPPTTGAEILAWVCDTLVSLRGDGKVLVVAGHAHSHQKLCKDLRSTGRIDDVYAYSGDTGQLQMGMSRWLDPSVRGCVLVTNGDPGTLRWLASPDIAHLLFLLPLSDPSAKLCCAVSTLSPQRSNVPFKVTVATRRPCDRPSAPRLDCDSRCCGVKLGSLS